MAVETPLKGNIGDSIKRKEDDRFIRGRGNYLDDIVLPGMLYMAIHRSPFAHARIKSINTDAAQAVPGVIAVVTGALLVQHKLAWMPTLSGDTQAVLATDKVRFQGQEVACVIATDPYVARDAAALVEVDYDVLPAVVTPQQALRPDAPLIRDEKEGQTNNHIYHWEAGDKAKTDEAFAKADRVVKLETFYPRCHPSPLETCGIVADVNPATGHATLWMTSQAPHAHRTLFAIVAGLPEQNIRIISPDIGGGFGNKVPIYPGYVVATAASYLIERLVESAALEMNMDPTEIRLKNFIQPEQFPYMSATGFEYDSGNYPRAMQLALDKLGYKELRKEQAEKRKKGELMGIGVASFTEVVGAGPGKHYDIAGLRMFDSAELRVHPTGKAILKLGVKSQGQGHETTFAQIVTEELGIPAADVEVQEGDTDNTPYGLGTYASRSTPVGGAATAMVSRKLRDKAKQIAAHLLEASEADIDFDHGKFFVRGSPSKSKSIQDVAFAAYTNLPDGMEAGLEGVTYYDPPNMTFPFGTYLVVVDIDRGTGQVKVRRMVAVDDCGVRINPMIVEGQIHGGLAEGFGIAFMELITFDEEGNCLGSNFTDYLLPTSWETPKFEMGETVTPSPHHPIGAKGVGESATVGSPAAFVNAVIDAVGHLGIRNIDMPVTSDKVWAALHEKGAAE